MTRPPHIEEFVTLAAAKQAIEIPIQYLPVLGALVVDPGATVTKLCQMTGSDVDAMSRTLKVLRVEYKVVDFEPDENDARKKHFYLTPNGRSEAVKWLSARNIALTEEQIDSILVIMPARRAHSRVRRGRIQE
jgi:DNA-binding MarR family transcriptional regulator